MDSPALLEWLDRHSIQYRFHRHPAVFTSQEARRLVPPLPGASAKNLFLRDKKGERFFLLTFQDTKTPDLKALAGQCGVSRLSLASAEQLADLLGVEAGAVSLLALVNDLQNRVEVLLDRDLAGAEFLHCHPLVNTATLVISLEGVAAFLNLTQHLARWIDIPQRNA